MDSDDSEDELEAKTLIMGQEADRGCRIKLKRVRRQEVKKFRRQEVKKFRRLGMEYACKSSVRVTAFIVCLMSFNGRSTARSIRSTKAGFTSTCTGISLTTRSERLQFGGLHL